MYLQQAYGYILRNDGTIFEGINNMHPYFWEDREQMQCMIQWFVEHTQNEKVKSLLQKDNRTKEENDFIFQSLNQEFCRIRTSCLRGRGEMCPETIFVRLSSDFSIWRDMLINLALDNCKHYTYITIVNDEQTLHNFDPVKINNVQLVDILIDDFVLL